jgi:hypothetical protein
MCFPQDIPMMLYIQSNMYIFIFILFSFSFNQAIVPFTRDSRGPDKTCIMANVEVKSRGLPEREVLH